MDLGLTDKVGIVTGSSRGLGLASARALVAEGCRVCICARGEERLAEAAIEVEAAAKRPHMVSAVQADVSTREGVERVIEQTLETFGRLDVLVNNVGRAGGSDLLDTSDAEWQAAFDETLFPAIRASRLAVPHMKAQGGGAIVMIASIYGRGKALQLNVNSPGYDSVHGDNIGYVDVSGVHNEEDGTIAFFAVNRHASESIDVELSLEGFGAASVIDHQVMTHANLRAVNTGADQNQVAPAKGTGAKVDGKVLSLKLAPYSYQMIRIKV